MYKTDGLKNEKVLFDFYITIFAIVVDKLQLLLITPLLVKLH